MLPYNKKLKSRSRELRSSMTDAEIKLWTKLKRKQIHQLQFCRQKPIGNFIVDFYCPKARLVIEIDGGQHYREQGVLQDAARDCCVRGLGLEVIRFSNRDVLYNLDGVLAVIVDRVEKALEGEEIKTP
jgi:very-short-patch-repair endonuclease